MVPSSGRRAVQWCLFTQNPNRAHACGAPALLRFWMVEAIGANHLENVKSPCHSPSEAHHAKGINTSSTDNPPPRGGVPAAARSEPPPRRASHRSPASPLHCSTRTGICVRVSGAGSGRSGLDRGRRSPDRPPRPRKVRHAVSDAGDRVPFPGSGSPHVDRADSQPGGSHPHMARRPAFRAFPGRIPAGRPAG